MVTDERRLNLVDATTAARNRVDHVQLCIEIRPTGNQINNGKESEICYSRRSNRMNMQKKMSGDR